MRYLTPLVMRITTPHYRLANESMSRYNRCGISAIGTWEDGSSIRLHPSSVTPAFTHDRRVNETNSLFVHRI